MVVLEQSITTSAHLNHQTNIDHSPKQRPLITSYGASRIIWIFQKRMDKINKNSASESGRGLFGMLVVVSPPGKHSLLHWRARPLLLSTIVEAAPALSCLRREEREIKPVEPYLGWYRATPPDGESQGACWVEPTQERSHRDGFLGNRRHSATLVR